MRKEKLLQIVTTRIHYYNLKSVTAFYLGRLANSLVTASRASHITCTLSVCDHFSLKKKTAN